MSDTFRRPKRCLGTLPPLKKGKDFDTLLANSLVLMKAGWEKGKAMATALNLAGYRPADSPNSTKSSSIVVQQAACLGLSPYPRSRRRATSPDDRSIHSTDSSVCPFVRG